MDIITCNFYSIHKVKTRPHCCINPLQMKFRSSGFLLIFVSEILSLIKDHSKSEPLSLERVRDSTNNRYRSHKLQVLER